MIIKSRTTPKEIHVLQALLRRLPPNHKERPQIKKDLAFCEKGFEGERKVDRFTNSILKSHFTILHDVYLDSSFQIDTLIIGPHCIFIVEIKNYAGTVSFDFNLNQFSREYNGKITGFRNPSLQATTNKYLLKEWLSHRGIANIPIYPLVVFSDPSTILKIVPEDRNNSDEVMHGEYLAQHILKVAESLKNGECKYTHQKIGALILNACVTYNFDYRKKYKIEVTHILSGVQCLGCGRLGMTRIYNSWICGNCSVVSKTAHKSALADYLLLIKAWITNGQCKRYLGINSKNIATKLLKEQNLIYNKDRRRWQLSM